MEHPQKIAHTVFLPQKFHSLAISRRYPGMQRQRAILELNINIFWFSPRHIGDKENLIGLFHDIDGRAVKPISSKMFRSRLGCAFPTVLMSHGSPSFPIYEESS